MKRLLVLVALGATFAMVAACTGRETVAGAAQPQVAVEQPATASATTTSAPSSSVSGVTTGDKAAVTATAARQPARPGAGGALPGTASRDVTYCTANGIDVKMDIYRPTAQSASAPVAMYVHGGGWTSGSKSTGSWLNEVAAGLLKEGFVVVSIDYRLAPTNRWPAQIEDVMCAVRYLRSHATQYGIDPDRIGTWGSSAGGHLASLLGTADASSGFGLNGQWSAESSRVQAVVDLFGPTDLTTADWASGAKSSSDRVFGTTTAALVNASPVSHVSPDDRPFLIIHGDSDPVVPYTQGVYLAEALESAGVPVTFVTVKGGSHGLGGRTEQPSRSELTAMVIAFFVDTLR